MILLVNPANGNILNHSVVPSTLLSQPPRLYIRTGTPKSLRLLDPRNGGIIMLDHDAPYPKQPNHSPFLHWLHLSPGANPQVSYMGPHPPDDSPPHRYVFYLVQGNLNQDFSALQNIQRSNFPFRQMLKHYGLEIVSTGVIFAPR